MFYLFNIALTPFFFLKHKCFLSYYFNLPRPLSIKNFGKDYLTKKIYSFRSNDTITYILPSNNKNTGNFRQGCVTHNCIIFSQIASIL